MSAQAQMQYDSERDNELKKRLQDILHKYNIK